MFHVVLIFPRKSAKTAHRCAVHTVPRAETGGICLAVGWSDFVLFEIFEKRHIAAFLLYICISLVPKLFAMLAWQAMSMHAWRACLAKLSFYKSQGPQK